jgi:hypothetical protein
MSCVQIGRAAAGASTALQEQDDNLRPFHRCFPAEGLSGRYVNQLSKFPC